MRNLKTLGLAVVAVLAMSALGASAAQGLTTTKTEFTPGGNPATKTIITGVQKPVLPGGSPKGHEFTVGSRGFVCEKAHFEGEITGNVTDVKITPEYKECKTTPVFFISFPVTVTMNECWYTFTGENTVVTGDGTKHYGVSVHLECPVGKKVEVHVYENSKHETSICTITIEPQTITGLWATNDPGGAKHAVTLHSDKNTKVKSTIHGSLCGGTETTDQEFDGIYESTTTITATQTGNPVDLTVSHTEVVHP